MPSAYDLRASGDVKAKKQSMADLKLRRLNELNSRLREDLDRPRITVSEASMSYVSRRQSPLDRDISADHLLSPLDSFNTAHKPKTSWYHPYGVR